MNLLFPYPLKGCGFPFAVVQRAVIGACRAFLPRCRGQNAFFGGFGEMGNMLLPSVFRSMLFCFPLSLLPSGELLPSAVLGYYFDCANDFSLKNTLFFSMFSER